MTKPCHSSIATAARKAGLARSGVRVDHVRFNRKLRLGSTDIQSAMDLRNPDRLVLGYTRLMMGFLLFQPRPRRILMIGLGGGSLPKFCFQHLPGSDITVVEINPQVIALRDEFGVPTDQEDFRVAQADGADFVAAAEDGQYNVILVDGFEADQMAPALGTLDFYSHCERLLSPGGVVVCNLHEADVHFNVYLQRLRHTFEDQVMAVPARECGNAVAYARKHMSLHARLPKHLVRPSAMALGAWADVEAELHDVLREARRAGEYR